MNNSPSNEQAPENSTGEVAPTSDKSTPSRRKFLVGGLAAGAVLGAPTAVAAASRRRPEGGRRRPSTGVDVPATLDDGTGSFVRIFDGPAFAEPSERLTEALVEVGKPGGIMDAKDPLEVGPIRLITEPELSPNNRDNPTHTAGSTFVGQFLDHDITSDAGSTLGVPTPASSSQNLRSARFDLDSVYGGGPSVSPHLYSSDPNSYGEFLVESGGLFEDLPRAIDGSAIVAEGRNDENLIISGLQVAFLKFHNQVLTQEVGRSGRRSRDGGSNGADRFRAAQQICRWHYQWLIVNQFLPQYVGQEMVSDILNNGRRWFTSDIGRIPLEFQGACYRFGHSMIRPSYRANLAGDNGDAFFALVFDPAEMGKADPNDLTGRVRAPRRFIGWQTFFDFGDGEVKPNKRVDTSISTPMFNLPTSTISSPSGQPLGPLSLPTRNLLRHITWELPSGQHIASSMGEDVLSASDLSDIGNVDAGLGTSTPLWFYILREADVFADGLHLGPVGGRIVAEVFIALLQNDPTSYFNADRTWRPTLDSKTDEFTMSDLLTVAGVDPTSRGQ